jgi:serine/threonine protein kinase
VREVFAGAAVDTSKPILQMVGDYDLLEKIAEGGMGSVYKARQRSTGLTVAMKIVSPNMALNPVLLKRFEQEFRAASTLNHPNIVRALDFGTNGTSPYLVMEFVEGESLGARLERERRLGEKVAIRIIAKVARGLRRAHKLGMVHRDVKPDNILITPDGQVKLADLGLVKEMEGDLNLTRTGRGLGTPHFMAPEQFRNAKNADIRCDIYSMAATLYMMVSGELPFKSTGPLDAWMKKMNNEIVPPRQIIPSLSERIDWAILRGMSGDPALRPATAREFVEDLTGRSTRKVNLEQFQEGDRDFWYLVYKDENDEQHTVKGTVGAIRRSLKEGLLGDASNVRASRSKTGPFEPLRGYPEFRDLVVAPAPMVVPGSPCNTSVPAIPRPTGRKSGSALPASRPKTPSSLDIEPLPEMDPQGAGAHRPEWVKWALLGLIAITAAIVGLFLFPR